MGNPVTGPNAAKVYISRNYFRPAALWVARPLPVMEDAGELGNTSFYEFKGLPRVEGRPAVRQATQLWNEAAGQKVFKITPDKADADVVVKRSENVPDDASGTGEYPEPGETEVVRVRPGFVNDPTLVAHELGHTQGLKHKHGNPTPSVMRYPGDKGYSPTPTKSDAKRIVKQQTVRSSGGNPSGGGSYKPKKKPSKPANEHKVTGGGARKIAQ